jgi:hypothetical protein
MYWFWHPYRTRIYPVSPLCRKSLFFWRINYLGWNSTNSFTVLYCYLDYLYNPPPARYSGSIPAFGVFSHLGLRGYLSIVFFLIQSPPFKAMNIVHFFPIRYSMPFLALILTFTISLFFPQEIITALVDWPILYFVQRQFFQ